ncbi:hypothetical protein OUZ56_010884 [Daphnia magna]|uniref:Uncharacterized protein n=1 Tax=Daphnia magna TaxID=35525 RepID=A0ABQ9YYQ6_9CRUS|nr:hypothetical protein OUZ56_010884 [Daphnia magna]
MNQEMNRFWIQWLSFKDGNEAPEDRHKLDDYQLKTCCTALNNALNRLRHFPDDLFMELRSFESIDFLYQAEDGKIIDSSPLAALTFIVQNGLSSV